MEKILLPVSILLKGVGALLAIWFLIYIIVSILRGEKQIVKKFHITFWITLMWCITIFLVSEIYEILVNTLIRYNFLIEKPLSDYTMPIFYIVLLMFLGMISMSFKKLEIFKKLSVFKDIKYSDLKNIVKYGTIGLIFGISYCSIIFALYVHFALIIGVSALAMHPMYGDNFLFFFGIGLLIAEIILGVFTGLKDGIKCGQQND